MNSLRYQMRQRLRCQRVFKFRTLSAFGSVITQAFKDTGGSCQILWKCDSFPFHALCIGKPIDSTYVRESGILSFFSKRWRKITYPTQSYFMCKCSKTTFVGIHIVASYVHIDGDEQVERRLSSFSSVFEPNFDDAQKILLQVGKPADYQCFANSILP